MKKVYNGENEPAMKGAAVGEHQAVTEFLEELRVSRRLSPHTLEAYRRDLARLTAFAKGVQLDPVTLGRLELEAFVRQLMAAGLSPRLVARVGACVRSFFRATVS